MMVLNKKKSKLLSGRWRIPTLKAAACAALVVASVGVAPPASAQCTAPKALTGAWKANDQGTYYMRRIGHNVWWLGDGPGDSWMHVFSGTEDGRTITGRWADVRGASGKGTLTLNIIGDFDRGIKGLEVAGGTGDGFAATRWFKECHDT
jgi:hypothetical protein